ncbi:MAG TPA: IPT/TIG domain-containing protein, partial [Thermoanaerobaculia bacterium]|nr:IPT/TIG domain-containing protein [Thermoanaerobaculia bacterium]
MKRLFLLLLLSLPAAAAPVITSISATSGPAAGSVVTISGSGFAGCAICSPPQPAQVVFGGVYVRTYVAYDADKTLTVVVPPHLPGTVDVTVIAYDGQVTLEDAFTFTGSVDDAFERVLLPILTLPTPGQFGSSFETSLLLSNEAQFVRAYIYGLIPPCRGISGCIVFDPHEHPVELKPQEQSDFFETDGTPGRFIYVAKPVAPTLAANLRVFDASRGANNFGTEIPLVRKSEFRTRIGLLGVPRDPRFRNTLRIYAASPIAATVRVGKETHVVQLDAAENLFDPAYGVFSLFPAGTETVDVVIDAAE